MDIARSGWVKVVERSYPLSIHKLKFMARSCDRQKSKESKVGVRSMKTLVNIRLIISLSIPYNYILNL
jgi:hypothetical protein